MTTTEATAAPASPARRATRRRLVTAVVAVLVLAALLVAGQWWTTPDLFHDSGAGMRLDPQPVAKAAVAFGVTAPLTDGESGPTVITFTDSAVVELPTNSAEAIAEVLVCRATRGADPIGAVPVDELDDFCDEVVPVEDGVRMVLSQWEARDRDYVVVAVTPTRPGRVHLAGVTLSYRTDRSHFYRRGGDRIGLHANLAAR